MPRQVTITFKDGTSHIYDNVPEDVRPEQIQARAAEDFKGLEPVSINREQAVEQTKISDITRGQSFNAPQRSLLERAADGAADFVNNFSPTAALVRGVRSALPATEDFRGSGNNSREALAQRAAQRVAQEERDAREQIAGRQADDPVYREGQSWYNPEALARGAADLGGAAVGGLVSDPTSLIAPGKSLLEKILGQFVVGGGADLATQGVEVAQDVRDNVDPVQSLIAGATGAALTGVASRFTTPEGDLLPKQLREEINKRFNALFETPYSKFEDFEQLAKELGTTPYGPEQAEALKKGIAARDQELNLPDGLSSKDAIVAVNELSGIRNDAANFRSEPDPKPTDMFPTDASRAADAEAWVKSLGKPKLFPVEPVVVKQTPAATAEPGPIDMTPQPSKAVFNPDPEPTAPRPPLLTRKEADALFKGNGSQTPAQWAKSLEKQIAAFKASSKKNSAEPAAVAVKPSAVKAETLEAKAPEANTVVPEKDLVSRFTSALTNAGKASKEQTALYKAERAKRFAVMKDKYEAGEGTRADFLAAKAALAGELPKADFKSIQDQFKPEEIDQLFMVLKDSKLSPDSKFSAENGLERLLNGNLPQPKQLANLAEVFPPDFIKAALSNRKAIKKFGGLVGEIWNTPKSLQSTADLSAPLRQGLGLAHREEFWKSLGPMVKAAFSPKTSEALEDAIKTHPRYDQAREAGLSLTTSKDNGLKEDMFRSNLAEKIPVWGKVVQGSERAYVGFLNKLRFDTFNSMMEQAKKLGHDLDDPEISKGISRYINVMTGRGGLGNLEKIVGELNNVLYSPGLISSRLQILTAPVTSVAGKGFIADLPKGMRKEALKSYAAIGAVNTTALGLATMAGLTVNLDPRSSDFLKAKDGDTRLDFGGGLTQYTTLAARAFTRERTTSGENGNTVEMKGKGGTPLDNDVQFVMNKMHPTLTLLLDQQRGANTVGEPFEWQKEIIERLTPMGFPDIAETLKEHSGNPGLFYSFLGLVGAGLSNYHSKSDDKNKDQEAEAPDKTR